jgi:hypothetical protein
MTSTGGNSNNNFKEEHQSSTDTEDTDKSSPSDVKNLTPNTKHVSDYKNIFSPNPTEKPSNPYKHILIQRGNKYNQQTPEKRIFDNIDNTSPSISKNPRLMEQASINLAQLLQNERSTSSTITVTPTKPKVPTKISELTQATRLFTLTLLVQYKYKLRQVRDTTIGQFIVYDQDGNSSNFTCFNTSIPNFYNNINENDYIELKNGYTTKTNEKFSLCNSPVDITISNNSTFRKLNNQEHTAFTVPFQPKTLAEIALNSSQDDVIDCVGILTTTPEPTETQEWIKASVTIKDNTGEITLVAWGETMVTCLVATSLLEQKVFAFQRLKCRIFQGIQYLQINEGAEILTSSEHEMFKNLCDYKTKQDMEVMTDKDGME